MSLQIKAARVTSQGGMAGRVRSGDPGLLGGILGGIGGFISGGPLGAIGGAVAGYKGTGSKPSMPAGPSSYPVMPTPGIGGTVARLVPGGKTGYQVNVPQNTGQVAPPKGYRWNKSGYWTKDGQYHPPGTKVVKIRRRNSMNPRALSRAMARVEGAKRIQSKLKKWTTPKYTGSGEKRAAC